jgi:hypothetical protein
MLSTGKPLNDEAASKNEVQQKISETFKSLD